MNEGKIQPQVLDIEELVLGALMLDSSAYLEVSDILRPEIFYSDAHSLVFQAIIKLINSDMAVDIVTVTTQLRESGYLNNVGGAYAISMLTSRVSGAYNIRTHAQVMYERYLSREIIRICSVAAQKGFEDGEDAFDLLTSAQDQLYKLSEITISKADKLSDTFIKHVLQLKQQYNTQNHNIGISTGLNNLDHFLLGFCPAHLVIIGGKPSEGKTTLAMQIMLNIAMGGEKVGFFSLEMSRDELQNKIISSIVPADSGAVRTANMKKEQWDVLDERTRQISDLPLWIDDTGGLTLNELKSKARIWVYKYGVKAIFIDYLQLIKADKDSKFGSREERVTYIANELKNLAKNLNIPVIALSQLNRKKPGDSPHKKPGLEDLRESGGIEQAADEVLLMYRYAYHQVKQWQVRLKDANGCEYERTEDIPHGLVEVIVAKNRNGKMGEAYVIIDLPTGRFKDYSGQEITEQTPF